MYFSHEENGSQKEAQNRRGELITAANWKSPFLNDSRLKMKSWDTVDSALVLLSGDFDSKMYTFIVDEGRRP